MNMIELYAVTALVLPWVVFRWYHSLTTVVYQGKVTVCKVGLLPRERSSVTSYDFLTALMPDGSHMVFEQSKAKLASLGELVYQPVVTVKRALFGGGYISDVLWPGDTVATAGDTKFKGVFLSLIYFLLGFLALGLAAGHYAEFGLLGFAYTAVLTMVAGLVLGAYKFASGTKVEGVRMLGLVNVGSGKGGLIAACAIAAVATAALFTVAGSLMATGGGFGVFVSALAGMSVAYSLGMLIALVSK